ncbi:MAG: putative metal-binding motif-containing protein [Polyangiaceae bacterium]|nr:putative metal-binding motif-containing protein [Polyangiaceae bacterium]
MRSRALLFTLAALGLALGCGRAELDLYPTEGGANAGGGGGSTDGGGGAGASGAGGSGGGVGGEGAGGSPACAVAQECDDLDPCTSNRCDGGECNFPSRDDDNDGQSPLQCGGLDCNDLNPEVFQGHPEDCFDGADNDCNGVEDCFDPACDGVPDCGCQPSLEVCDNGADDDCDRVFDCFDSDCQGTPACGCLPTEAGLCFNGFDDDCDGIFDCEDPDCAPLEECQCQLNFEGCFDGFDDDCDLLIDCADPDCDGVFPCACVPPGSPESCNDQVDNDCDSLPDCADADCFAAPACQTCEPEICDDGLDNDCDLQIDCADEACNFAPGCQPVPEVCNNAVDDDGDGLADCQDPDCANNPLCQQEQANCLSPKLIPGTGTYTGDTFGHANETEGTCGGQAGEAVFYFVLSEPSFVHLDSIGTQFDSVICELQRRAAPRARVRPGPLHRRAGQRLRRHDRLRRRRLQREPDLHHRVLQWDRRDDERRRRRLQLPLRRLVRVSRRSDLLRPHRAHVRPALLQLLRRRLPEHPARVVLQPRHGPVRVPELARRARPARHSGARTSSSPRAASSTRRA